MTKKNKLISVSVSVGIVLFAIIGIFITNSKNDVVNVSKSMTIRKNLPKGVFISEVMSNNVNTYIDENGNAPSYINLYNNSNNAISLNGYYISDDENNLKKCALPDVSVNSKDFFTIYSQSYVEDIKDTADTIGISSDNKFYINFRLNFLGETLYLTSPDEKTTTLVVPSLPSDIAYGVSFYDKTSKDYEYFSSGTVGNINQFEHSIELSQIYTAPQYNISISEYMTSNKSKVIDNYGKTSNWIELYNSGDEDVDLSGMVLSDNPAKPNKWTIPNGVTIKANDYLVIWLDKLDEYKDNNLHSSFKFGENDDKIILTDTNYTTVFEANIKYIDKDISVGFDDTGNLVYYNVPTPGEPNDNPYDTIQEAMSLDLKDIYISEVSAFPCGENTEDFDWVELYNNSNHDINLDGWKISKKFNADEPYVFSNVTIKSGQYLLLYAVGEDFEDYETDNDENYYTHDDSGDRVYLDANGVYLPFKIGVDGEKIYLFDDSGECVDYFKSGWASPGDTCGRSGNLDEIVYYNTPSPGTQNSKVSYLGYTDVKTTEFSNNGGYASVGEKITADIPEDITIRYTDDGSEPDTSSKIFSNYTVTQNCVLRFKFYQDDYLPSTITSATYIVSEKHDIPFVAISTDEDNLFSNSTGILAYGNNYNHTYPYHGANFWQDWEREISFEYYTPDGEKEINCLAGTKVFGQYSRANDQKSLAIYFRGKYGTSSVDYQFFEDNDVTEVSSLVLRAGGQDQKYTRIRDAFTEEVVSQYSDIACMDWQPIAVYINGEYWGYFDLREKINADWFKSHEDIDPENLSLLKGSSSVRHGSKDSYIELLNYIQNNDLSIEENYEHVTSIMDVDNFTDYLIAEIFFANTDSGNIKFYVDESGGKWRWVLFDLDMSMRPTCVEEGGYNSIQEMFDPAGHGAKNMFTTIIQRSLIKNKGYREKFISRYAELLNSYFMPDKLTEKFDYMTSLMDSEMVLHGERWEKPTYEKWLSYLDEYHEVINARRDVCKKQLIDFFDLSSDEVAKLFPNDTQSTSSNHFDDDDEDDVDNDNHNDDDDENPILED